MVDYRRYGMVPAFELDRRPGRSRMKIKCPKCGGERCLTPYINVKTGEPVGPEFGRCDHERRCGYDRRPTGKDVGNNELWVNGNECLKAYKLPVRPDVMNYIPHSEVAKTINPGLNNKLFEFLAKYWDKNLVSDVFRKYYVGTMDLWGWKGCSVFWQLDQEFVFRTGKIMEYNIKVDQMGRYIDVKRAKDDFPHVTFYHSLKGQDFIFKQCLFGEHLLNYWPIERPVNLVEAEKTAIVCSINKPNQLFLATGGLQNMRPEVMKALARRRVVAFPDKGSAFDVWKDKIARNLPGYKIEVSDCLQSMTELGDGDDLADLIIKNKVSG